MGGPKVLAVPENPLADVIHFSADYPGRLLLSPRD